MRVCKEELEFLKRLAKYFKNVPSKEIDQSRATIYDHNPCGCFGAHIAKSFDKKWFRDPNPEGYYYFLAGKEIFDCKTIFTTEDLFVKHGASYGIIFGKPTIFSTADWDEHPYEVIKKVINEIEKVIDEIEKGG